MKHEVTATIPSESAHALTISTRFPNDEFGPPAKSKEPVARPYRKRGYFLSSSRSLVDRLRAAAIKFASIVMLVAGFIMAALFALDLMDMLRW
jgi:hypothetical protein